MDSGWLAVLVVSRDVIIVGGLSLLQYSGVDVRQDIKPVLASKLTTLAQIALVLFIMVEHSLESYHPLTRAWLIVAVAVLTVVTGVYYVQLGLRKFPTNGAGAERR